jgi:hypothetical protein
MIAFGDYDAIIKGGLGGCQILKVAQNVMPLKNGIHKMELCNSQAKGVIAEFDVFWLQKIN